MATDNKWIGVRVRGISMGIYMTKGSGATDVGADGDVRVCSERQPYLERFDDGRAGVVDADDAEQTAEEYDETVEHYGAPFERVALQL